MNEKINEYFHIYILSLCRKRSNKRRELYQRRMKKSVNITNLKQIIEEYKLKNKEK